MSAIEQARAQARMVASPVGVEGGSPIALGPQHTLADLCTRHDTLPYVPPINERALRRRINRLLAIDRVLGVELRRLERRRRAALRFSAYLRRRVDRCMAMLKDPAR